MDFLEQNHRNPSRHHIEEHVHLNWLKANRKLLNAGQPAPEYRQNEFMVYATIRQHGDAAGQLNGQLNDSQKETLEFIKAHDGYNTTRIADGLGKPFRTIDKHINVLLELNMIERRGSKKTGGYYPV